MTKPTRRFSSGPLLAALLLGSCATPPAPVPDAPSKPAAPAVRALPQETHLAELRQLTFGGENAEAYWSFDGKRLSFQARKPGEGCDRIYRLDAFQEGAEPARVSSGKGATTCAHFLPGGEELVFASTHLGGDGCPPKPDHSAGYVWALYESYDIFRARADGSGLTRLTSAPGYDAEATVCAKDGSIVFTSVRDGDLELYRMDADGSNVKRLTSTPGYDGGAFFNRDCTKLVWRASRPRPGKELEEYQALLARGLVRPSKLELFVANADGSDARQVTYLDAASFAPFFHPTRERILFSTNYPNPRGREFDLWAVNVDGSELERITHAPGFDGFPMFSPDGRWLAFSSNRATEAGASDTNVFLARWVDSPPKVTVETAADRVRRDVAWLADPAREGRGVGTQGLEEAGAYVERRFAELGLSPGASGTFRQPFSVVTGIRVEESTRVKLGGAELPRDALAVMGFSSTGKVKAPLVLAGYGLRDAEHKLDDYAGVNARGKVVVVRRFVPDTPTFSDPKLQRRLGDLRLKAWTAREQGAKALVVVDWPEPPAGAAKDWRPPPEARLPAPHAEGASDAGIPVVVVKRSALEGLWPKLVQEKRVEAELVIALAHEKKEAFNVVGRIAAGASDGSEVVIGAHYDHLGRGGPGSLAPDSTEPHLGADDNASGVAALLEIARELSRRRSELKRDVVLVAFSGEESGLLGSTHFARERGEGLERVVAMLNLDMVGRLRENRLSVLGGDSAEEWAALVEESCRKARVECSASGDGYGPSDQTPFYAAGAPVLHFFTGAHSDYHKPSDAPARINAAGAAQIALVTAELALRVSDGARLTYRKVPSPAPRGDLRSFNASLGTIPDYAGAPGGAKGVLLAGTRPGGAADLAGMRRGDLLVRLGKSEIGSVEDLMYVLNASRPNETVKAVVLREGKPLELEVTFQESKRH